MTRASPLATGLLELTFLLLGFAPGFDAIQIPAGWSDPIIIADTTVAAPPALAAVADQLHLFWLDAPVRETVLRHAVVDKLGRVLRSPADLAVNADRRFGWPVAAATNQSITVAWISRSGGVVQLMTAALDPSGAVRAPPAPAAPPGEESGRISVQASAGGVDLVWSQFDHGARRIWYARLGPDARAVIPARVLTSGDAPALVSGSTIVWWDRVGFDTYRLMQASLTGGQLTRAQPLTGTIGLTRILPVVPVRSAAALDLLIPIVERAFGTAGRLHHIRVTSDGVSPRVLLLPGRSISDLTISSSSSIVAWVEAVGRRRNSEVFAAAFGPQVRLTAPSRVSLSPSGSIRPAVSILGGQPVAAWLEVTGITRFKLLLAIPSARRARFLMGVPELDLSRPMRLLAFGMTVTASVLPYAAILGIAFGLPTTAATILAVTVFSGFGWWRRLTSRATHRLAAMLVFIIFMQIAGRSLIPGNPPPVLLITAMASTGLFGLVAARYGWLRETIRLAVGVWLILFVELVVVLFPWGAAQLSQY